MAKNDASKAQNQIDYRGNYAQNTLDNTRNNLVPQNQALQNRYNVSADQSERNYADMFNQYNNLYGQTQNMFQPQRAGYQDFATTGGFTPQNIQDIRARAEAPIRGAYSNAQAEVERNKALSGGYSPNANAALAKMSREQSYANSDAETNANAAIAQLVQQGKLAGLGGLNTTDTAQLGALNEALTGQRSLYGTTPGQTSMYGTQLGQSNAQLNDVQQLQNQLANYIMQAQLGKSNIPSNYQQALGNIGGTLGLGGQIFSGLSGLGGLSGGGGLYGVGSGQTPAGYIGG
jgi:hypothetical protein